MICCLWWVMKIQITLTILHDNATLNFWLVVQRILIHKMTMMSFAIALYGQCCRLHVVGQQVVSDINVIHSCWSISGLCFESNNTNMLHACPLMYSECLFCFKYHTYLALQHGGVYLVTIIHNLVTSLHVIYSTVIWNDHAIILCIKLKLQSS